MTQEINLTPTAPSRYHDYEATCWENGHEKGVKVGIAYQKEQDKELIEELLGVINATMCYREYSTVTEREKAEAMFGKIRIHFQL